MLSHVHNSIQERLLTTPGAPTLAAIRSSPQGTLSMSQTPSWCFHLKKKTPSWCCRLQLKYSRTILNISVFSTRFQTWTSVASASCCHVQVIIWAGICANERLTDLSQAWAMHQWRVISPAVQVTTNCSERPGHCHLAAYAERRYPVQRSEKRERPLTRGNALSRPSRITGLVFNTCLFLIPFSSSGFGPARFACSRSGWPLTSSRSRPPSALWLQLCPAWPLTRRPMWFMCSTRTLFGHMF